MEDNFISGEIPSSLKAEIDDVKSVVRDTIVDFHNYIFPKYIKNYKDYLWFVAERMWSIDPWQSNINYPMVSSTVDTMFGNIFDFGYEFWIKELGLKQLCTKAFDFRWTGKKVFKEVVKEVLICGKWYVKDYFIKEEHEDIFFGKKINQTIKTPSIIYMSIFDVMYDRSKWLEQSSYKIVRTFTTWEAIKAKVLPLLIEQSWSWRQKEVENKLSWWLKKYKQDFWHRFSMYDYNPVKSLAATTQRYDSMKSNKAFFELPNASNHIDLTAWYANTQTGIREDSKNYFLNDRESSYELLEYITNTKRYIFINWNLVYFGEKRFNLGEIREATYNIIPWTGNAMGTADKQSNLQAIQNTLWNAFIDNIKLNLWPIFKVSGNLPMAKNGRLDFKSFMIMKTQWGNDIEKVQLWVSDFAPLNFMQMVETASQKDFAMTNYVTGWGWAIERTQWWIDLKFNQYKSRLTPITDSIDQMMWNIARSWIMMYLKFFTKEELEKLWVMIEEVYETDKNWNNKFKTITLNKIDVKEIIDETNITFTYNSLDKVTKEWTRATIVQNLQYLLQYAWWKLNMEQVSLILSWLDFDPLKLFQSKAAVENWQSTQNPQQEQYQQEYQWEQQQWYEQSYWWEDEETQSLDEQLANLV